MCQRPPVERTWRRWRGPGRRLAGAALAVYRAAVRAVSLGSWRLDRAVLAGSIGADVVEAVEEVGAFGDGDAGAAVLDGEADPAAVGTDLDADLAVRAGVPAGVVDQHPGQPVDPLRGRAYQHGVVRGLGADRGADGAEPVRAGLGQRAQVDRLLAGRRRPGVEPGQPEHVVHQAPQPLALTLDPGQCVAVLAGLARGGQGHVGLGPDHAQRGAQLVRGVGGELELAAPRLLDRGQRAQADHEQAAEHRQQQERPGDDLAVQQQALGVLVAGHALARDQPAVAVPGQLEPERAERGERRRRTRTRRAGSARMAGARARPGCVR